MRKFERRLAVNSLLVGDLIVRVATARGLVLEFGLDILLSVVFGQAEQSTTLRHEKQLANLHTRSILLMPKTWLTAR